MFILLDKKKRKKRLRTFRAFVASRLRCSPRLPDEGVR